jgi:hypothetical protein
LQYDAKLQPTSSPPEMIFPGASFVQVQLPEPHDAEQL